MSPEDTAAQEEAEHVVAVANAVMAAKAYDREQCARGLAIVATVIAGDDASVRTVLAKEMLRLARELDPDLVDARWN